VGWDRRGYYYRVRKVQGRVVREYVGGGLAGMLAEAQDERDRARRAAARAAWRAERDRARGFPGSAEKGPASRDAGATPGSPAVMPGLLHTWHT
jgi:hypothetical protein